MADFEPLKERIRRVFDRHIEHDHGLITAPDRLLDNTLAVVSEWLQHDEEQWGNTEGCVSEALRDLRTNQMR